MKKILLYVLNLIVLVFMATSCMYTEDNMPNKPTSNYFSGSFSSMNTVIQLSLEAKNQVEAQKYLEGVKNIYNEIDEEADASLSSFINEFLATNIKNPDVSKIKSELGLLNYYREYEVSDSLLELIEFALDAKEKTLGFFNPCLGILNAKWKAVITGVAKPSIMNVGDVLHYAKLSRDAKIKIDGNKVTLLNADNKLSTYEDYLVDLGGIAKGYATEKAEKYLKKQKRKYYLLNGGASNIEVGEHITNSDYNINISYVFGYPNKNPFITNEDGYFYIDDNKTNVKYENGAKSYITEKFYSFTDLNKMKKHDLLFSLDNATYYEFDGTNLISKGSLNPVSIKVKNKAIVTSSPGQQNFIDGDKIYHHIINPFTGYPACVKDSNNTKFYRDSVTIIGDDSGLLDAYSTALFSMNDIEALDFVKNNNLSVIFLKDEKLSYISEGITYEEKGYN